MPEPGRFELTARMLAFIFGFIAASLSISPAFAADPSLPKADELVKKFVARVKEEDRENIDDQYGYVEHRLHDELNKDGSVKEHSDETFRIVLLENHRYPRLIAKDGKPLVSDEQRKQAEREEKFLDDQRKKDDDKKDSDDRLKLDDQFLDHFKFDVVGEEVLNGRPSYIVTVLPKSGDLSVRNNTEKVFTHLQGKVWVDAQDFTLVKSDLHLTETTSFYGFLGAIRQLDLLLQRRWVDKKVWLMEKLDYTIDARKLLTNIRMRQHSEYSNYRKLAK
jgi:hypothetical protein